MKYFATDIKNEWYKVSREIAITRVDEQLDAYNNKEYGYNS